MAKKSNPEKELKLDENVKVEIIENSIEATGLDEKDIQINSLIEENKELKETVDVLNNQIEELVNILNKNSENFIEKINNLEKINIKKSKFIETEIIYKYTTGESVFYEEKFQRTPFTVMRSMGVLNDIPAYRIKSNGGIVVEIVTEDKLTLNETINFKRDF